VSDQSENQTRLDRGTAPRYAEIIKASQKTPGRNWREILDERQLKELEFATVYREQFHHGTSGHNQLMLIAQLGEVIDFIIGNYMLVEQD
jgi:hypothetical protein